MSEKVVADLRAYLKDVLREKHSAGELIQSALQDDRFRGSTSPSDVTWVLWDLVSQGEARVDSEHQLVAA